LKGETHPLRRIVVSSGPTRAYIDSIRYIANTSSGALGSCIVGDLLERGFALSHVYGQGSITPGGTHPLLEAVPVVTVDELVISLRMLAGRGDIAAVVHAMAVLDYVPESRLTEKKASGDDNWDIRLVKTPKVIALIRELLPDAVVVGFKLESGISKEELLLRAEALLEKNRLDLVVANLLERVGDERHEAVFVGPGGTVLGQTHSKADIAEKIGDFIAARL